MGWPEVQKHCDAWEEDLPHLHVSEPVTEVQHL